MVDPAAFRLIPSRNRVELKKKNDGGSTVMGLNACGGRVEDTMHTGRIRCMSWIGNVLVYMLRVAVDAMHMVMMWQMSCM